MKLEKKFECGDLKKYKYWILRLSFRQHTLGSAIILSKRSIEKISELSNEEIIELKQVMLEYEKLLLKAPGFMPDRFNYLQLGNSLNQLHFHCIPRYSSIRHFADIKWIDSTYGRPPIFLKKDKESSIELIEKIKNYLIPLL